MPPFHPSSYSREVCLFIRGEQLSAWQPPCGDQPCPRGRIDQSCLRRHPWQQRHGFRRSHKKTIPNLVHSPSPKFCAAQLGAHRSVPNSIEPLSKLIEAHLLSVFAAGVFTGPAIAETVRPRVSGGGRTGGRSMRWWFLKALSLSKPVLGEFVPNV